MKDSHQIIPLVTSLTEFFLYDNCLFEALVMLVVCSLFYYLYGNMNTLFL